MKTHIQLFFGNACERSNPFAPTVGYRDYEGFIEAYNAGNACKGCLRVLNRNDGGIGERTETGAATPYSDWHMALIDAGLLDPETGVNFTET